MNQNSTMFLGTTASDWEGAISAFWIAACCYENSRSRHRAIGDVADKSVVFHGRALMSAATRAAVTGPTVMMKSERRRMSAELARLAHEFDEPFLDDLSDLLQASSGELPERVRQSDSYIIRPVPPPQWPPACAFWQGWLGGSFVGTELDAVLLERPATPSDLVDKLKVITFFGLVSIKCSGRAWPERLNSKVMIRWSEDILTAPHDTCMSVFENRRPYNDVWHAARNYVDGRTNVRTDDLFLLVLGTTPPEWNRTLREDAERLGMKIPRR